MQQSSHLFAALPACLLTVLTAAIWPLASAEAQDRYRVTRQENFRRDPGPSGRLLASVRQGVLVEGGETRSGWVEVTLDGWIWAESLARINSTAYDYEVSASRGENLRAAPNGQVIARLDTGFWLQEIEDRGAWVRVSRTAWMWGRSLERVTGVVGSELATAEAPVQAAPAPTPPSDNGTGRLDRAVTVGPSALQVVPDGDTTATLAGGAAVHIVARSGGWVRVQTEGWIHERDLRPVSGDVLVGISGAEVRARPEDFEGRTLQWTLQLLAVQTSDGLRRELPVGRRYMLARGPVPEAGFVYVLLADDQVDEVERLQPLAEIVTLVRVRVGRDRYLGQPVVELVEMTLRKP